MNDHLAIPLALRARGIIARAAATLREWVVQLQKFIDRRLSQAGGTIDGEWPNAEITGGGSRPVD